MLGVFALLLLGQTAMPSLSSAAPAQQFCAVSVSATRIEGDPTRYALGLSSRSSTPFSGRVALYAGEKRYDIDVHDAVAPDFSDNLTVPTPVVVQFPEPTTLDSAYVSRLGNDGCDVPFRPWRRTRSEQMMDPYSVEAKKREAAFAAAARTAVPRPAPLPVNDPRPCAQADRPATTVRAAAPQIPQMAQMQGIGGTVFVRVLLSPDDAILATDISRSASVLLNNSALAAANASQFRGETYRCKPTFGEYLFTVNYLDH